MECPLEICEEVKYGLPVRWSRIHLEAREDAESVSNVGACGYLHTHAGAEGFTIGFVFHIMAIFFCLGELELDRMMPEGSGVDFGLQCSMPKHSKRRMFGYNQDLVSGYTLSQLSVLCI